MEAQGYNRRSKNERSSRGKAMKFFFAAAVLLASSLLFPFFSCTSEGSAASGSLPSPLILSGTSSSRRMTPLDSSGGSASGTPAPAVSGGKLPRLDPMWAKGALAGELSVYFHAVAADAAGNTYVAGLCFNGAIQLDPGITLDGPDVGENALIIKYDVSGKVLWARTATAGTARSRFNAVAVDASGSVYAAGFMGQGKAEFGGSVKVEGKGESQNFLLVKYDPRGKALWAQTPAGAQTSGVNSLAIDKAGNVYVAGHFYGDLGDRIEFPRGTPDYAALPDPMDWSGALVAKFDPSGKALWAAQIGSSSDFFGVAVDNAGGVYAAGYFGGDQTFVFGNGVMLNGSTPGGLVLVKYSSAGKAQWVKTLQSGNPESLYESVAVDAAGNVYAMGEIHGTDVHDFGNGVIAAGPSKERHPLIVKYDSAGTPLWARSLLDGGGDFDYKAAAVDGSSVYLAGALQAKTGETYDFGGGMKIAGNGGSISWTDFLAAYDFDGNPRWVMMPPQGGLGYVGISALCPAGKDALTLAGTLYGNGAVDMGNGIAVKGGFSSPAPIVAKYRVQP
jgi:hypothetical protein